MSLRRRATIFAALGDPSRLAIVEALALTDGSPSDLEEALGIRSNLLTHHLDTLESVGLVRRLRSAGDGRRRYVRLVLTLPYDLIQCPRVEATSVLFICRYNSARSQFAAAYWNQHSEIPAGSAGVQPAQSVHPWAVQAAASRGLDLHGQTPRGYGQVGTMPDLVVSVCDIAHEDVSPFTRAQHLHWSIPDPSAGLDSDAFDTAFGEIAQRIDLLVRSVSAPTS